MFFSAVSQCLFSCHASALPVTTETHETKHAPGPGAFPSISTLCLLISLLPGFAKPLEAQEVWEWSPYRVQAYLALSPSLDSKLHEEHLAGEISRQVANWIGAHWDFSIVSSAPPLRRKMVGRFEEVAFDDLPPSIREQDKIMLICVKEKGNSLTVEIQELDIRTRIFNQKVSEEVLVPLKLVDTILRCLSRAFAPLAKVEKVQDEEVRLVQRAAAIRAENSAIAPVPVGTLFVPVVRYNDRRGEARHIEMVRWTALIVEENLGSELVCHMETGLRTPLSSRRRGRFEQLAIALKLPERPTRIRLVSRTDPREPLPDYHIFEKNHQNGTVEKLGTSNAMGEVLLLAKKNGPLRVLLIKHAEELLARLPVMVGLDLPDPIYSVSQDKEPNGSVEEISESPPPAKVGKGGRRPIGPILAPIMKDDLLLKAKGALIGLQEELIDQMAYREILLARGRRWKQEDNRSALEEVKQELRRLKDRDRYLLEVDQLKNRFHSEDPIIQYRLDRLFDNTKTLVINFLEPLPSDPFVSRNDDAPEPKEQEATESEETVASETDEEKKEKEEGESESAETETTTDLSFLTR